MYFSNTRSPVWYLGALTKLPKKTDQNLKFYIVNVHATHITEKELKIIVCWK